MGKQTTKNVSIMRTIPFFLLLIGLMLTVALPAQRRNVLNSTRVATVKPGGRTMIQAKCQSTTHLNLAKGAVHTPQHLPTNKVTSGTFNGAFYIRALKPISDQDLIWAKFYLKPGFPSANITGLTVKYRIQTAKGNNPKLTYISQSRITQGPTPDKGTVRLDDGKNLYQSGAHTAKPFGGQFACGNDWKTVSFRLAMQPGDQIIISGVVVHFDCGKDPVTALCPTNVPNPVLKLTGDTYSNGFTRYQMSVINWKSFPGLLFQAAPTLPACGLNKNASRTWVDIYNERNQRIYGFCALGDPKGLTKLWFAVKKGDRPPYRVRIVMTDRLCKKRYVSNWISIPQS